MGKRNSRYCDGTLSTFSLSEKDKKTLTNLSLDSRAYKSGGSYNILAKWVKGGKVVVGRNKLNRPANTINRTYPELCGMHAELDLFRQKQNLKGGTVYIAGTKSNGCKMLTTKPCIYCAAILTAAEVKYVVYYQNLEPTKTVPKQLLG